MDRRFGFLHVRTDAERMYDRFAEAFELQNMEFFNFEFKGIEGFGKEYIQELFNLRNYEHFDSSILRVCLSPNIETQKGIPNKEQTKTLNEMFVKLYRLGVKYECATLEVQDYYGQKTLEFGATNGYYWENRVISWGFKLFWQNWKQYKKRMEMARTQHKQFMQDLSKEIEAVASAPPDTYPVIPNGGQLYLEALQHFTNIPV
jgi:hypothetical protein